MKLRGQRIAITGASSGIGRALALRFAREGAQLWLGARRQGTLDQVAVECRAAGAAFAQAAACDVEFSADCAAFIAQGLAALGGLDVLVNNAGVSMVARFEDVTDFTAFETLLRVNYLGAVHCTHAALPALRQSGGQVVAVSSLTGLTGVPSRSAYAASKHALQGFFDSLRIELRGSGVNVLVVSPGFVGTEMREHAFGPGGQPLGVNPRAGRKAMTPERCAARIAQAIEGRKRELVMGSGRLLQLANLICPSLVDRLVAKEMT